MAAAAPSRGDRTSHARVGRGQALDCRSGVLPRRKGRSHPRGEWSTSQIRRTGRRRREASVACAGKRHAETGRAFQAHRHPAKRLDTPAKVNGTAVYGIDVRPPGVKIATLAQSPVFGGRVKSVDDTGGQGRQGRAPDRAPRRRRRCGRRPHGGREERSCCAHDRMGRRSARQAQHERRSWPSSKRRRSNQVRWRRTSAMSTRRWRAPSPRSRRPTRFRSSRHAAHGADELHGSCPQGRLRNLGRQPGHRTLPRRRPRRPPACRWTRSWSTII